MNRMPLREGGLPCVESAHPRRRVVAFVLEGGASHGAVQAGTIQGLVEAGIEADMFLGASVGAFNAAFLAGFARGGSKDLTDVWRSIRRRDVFVFNPVAIVGGLLGLRPSIASNQRVAALAQRCIPYTRIEQATRPLVVAVTDARTGSSVELDSGLVSTALLASTAMPGIFGPVTADGRLLIDGAISSDAPIEAAISRGATDIFVIPTASPSPGRLPRHPLSMVQQGIGFAIDQHNRTAEFAARDRVRLQTTPTVHTEVNPLDFSHAEELIELGYRSATRWALSHSHA
jgi:NTE family protein